MKLTSAMKFRNWSNEQQQPSQAAKQPRKRPRQRPRPRRRRRNGILARNRRKSGGYARERSFSDLRPARDRRWYGRRLRFIPVRTFVNGMFCLSFFAFILRFRAYVSALTTSLSSTYYVLSSLLLPSQVSPTVSPAPATLALDPDPDDGVAFDTSTPLDGSLNVSLFMPRWLPR